ncbi:MAG: hypothetical protein JWN34_2060 [Bryobacterales bacterium]|nr:hypothetical protein [Bryobacterales bacterium]
MKLGLSRRVRRLEQVSTDHTGLRPHSEPWFAFWEDKLYRLMAGENIGNVMIPIAVTDRMIHGPEPDRQASKAHPASPDVKHW